MKVKFLCGTLLRFCCNTESNHSHVFPLSCCTHVNAIGNCLLFESIPTTINNTPTIRTFQKTSINTNNRSTSTHEAYFHSIKTHIHLIKLDHRPLRHPTIVEPGFVLLTSSTMHIIPPSCIIITSLWPFLLSMLDASSHPH